jgi:hypothetical protein
MALTGQEQTASANVALIEVTRTHHLVLKSLGDLTADELQRSPVGGLSPIIWQVGHIAASDAYFAGLCGQSVAVDDTFRALFGRKTGGVKPYPSLAVVQPVHDSAHMALAAIAQSADLSRAVGGEFFKTVGDVVSFACFHRGYHIGKICTLRALLGKPACSSKPAP